MVGKQTGYYRVVDELGIGGMGSTWEAEDTTLGRLVALEIIIQAAEAVSAGGSP
ncbi:hypothetical protein ACFL3H_10220 [Gemmatimonadota bacterium]